MTWQELSSKQENPEQTERYNKVAAGCTRALEAGGEELTKWLRGIAEGGSYAPGRQPSDVAYAEGKRALAVMMLKLGGVYD